MTKLEKTLLLITAAFFLAACFLVPGCSSVLAKKDPVITRPMETAQPVSPENELWIVLEKRIDLNHATAEELTSLPGIGPVTAANIVSYREENGYFTSLEELLNVSGIGSSTLDQILAYMPKD